MPFFDEAKLEVMIDADAIAARIAMLGKAITDDYRDKGEVVLVGVLKGSFVFLADLARAVDLPVDVDFLGVSSYGSAEETSGVVRLTRDLSRPIRDKHVILVEDIVDTGLTMKYLLEMLATRHPATLRVASLLHKPARTRVEVAIEYLGFTIADEFVVGYGLDMGGKLRNLPFIGVNRSSGQPW